MSYGDSKVRSVNYDMFQGVNRDRSGQEGTLYGVNKDLFITRMHVIWGQ
jgi:hypothetical protein